MSNFVSASKAFIDDESGVTAIEYGLIASLVAVGIVVAAGAMGGKLTAMYDYIVTTLAG